MHGGVYVPATENTKSNSCLEDPLRDVETIEGIKLTKVNPAYMTRMIAEFLKVDDEIKIHLTSLKLLNPSNKADEWEERALKKFEDGVPEFSSIEGENNKAVFRYMVPLVTEKSCLNCHEKQGYKEGEIRGGISISFPYNSYQVSMGKAFSRIYIRHAFFLLSALF